MWVREIGCGIVMVSNGRVGAGRATPPKDG